MTNNKSDKASTLIPEECQLGNENLRLVYRIKIGKQEKMQASITLDIDLESISDIKGSGPAFFGLDGRTSPLTVSFERASIKMDVYDEVFSP